MEEKEWGLIVIALFLALAFSVSPAEAQFVWPMCENSAGQVFEMMDGGRCDKDGDCFVKRNKPCQLSNPLADVDCDDNDNDPDNNCLGDGGTGGGSGGHPEFVVDLVNGNDFALTNDDDRLVCANQGGIKDLVHARDGKSFVSNDTSDIGIRFLINEGSQLDPVHLPGRNGDCGDNDDFVVTAGSIGLTRSAADSLTGFTAWFRAGPSPSNQSSTGFISLDACNPIPANGFDLSNCVMQGSSNDPGDVILSGTALNAYIKTCPTAGGVVCFTVHLHRDAQLLKTQGSQRTLGTVSLGDLIFTRVEN